MISVYLVLIINMVLRHSFLKSSRKSIKFLIAVNLFSGFSNLSFELHKRYLTIEDTFYF